MGTLGETPREGGVERKKRKRKQANPAYMEEAEGRRETPFKPEGETKEGRNKRREKREKRTCALETRFPGELIPGKGKRLPLETYLPSKAAGEKTAAAPPRPPTARLSD